MDKHIALALIVATSVGAANPAGAASEDQTGLRFLMGYRSQDISDYEYVHNTHPGDSFLPAAQIPGSAGTTSLGNRLDLLALGLGWQTPVGKSLRLNFDLGGLLGGARDETQNLNDSRPAANGAFIYSEAKWGLFAAAGLTYQVSHALYAGIEAQLAGIQIESGWDRFGEDESTGTTFEVFPSIGPKLGLSLNKQFGVEGTVQFGRSTGVAVNGVFRF